jgi:bifunctional non-homologous end joining protein LigD
MSLKEYQKKRDFKSSPEPEGKKESSKGGPRKFVVQKHQASQLHYDFRLELDGVLKSWAVPKGPSLDPSVKRLAVQVEDHPVEYAGFEGVIPEDEYGGGTVMVWDTGTWKQNGDAREGLKNGSLKFELKGKKLKGGWALVQMKGRGDKNWLLIKEKDQHADRETDILGDKPNSAVSGKSLEQIAEAADQEGHDE